jgi:hypothetical protein
MELSKTIDELEADFYAQKPLPLLVPVQIDQKEIEQNWSESMKQLTISFDNFYNETQL